MHTLQNPLKTFISYSHKDKKYLDEFLKHLKPLCRQGYLENWTDRELIVGDHLDSKIIDNLDNANLVIFLVSADFLDSEYCYDIELTNSLERMKSDGIGVIPIIIKNCRWKDTPLKDYLVLPEDGVPVKSFSNEEDAWVSVVDAIKKKADNYNDKENNISSSKTVIDSGVLSPSLTSDFIEYLSDTEIKFQHKFKEKIVLDDIYINPDLKEIGGQYGELESLVNSLDILGKDNKKTLIIGSEQSGKTSLAKTLFYCSLDKGYIPLILKGREVSNTDGKKTLKKNIKKTYKQVSLEELLSSDKEIFLIIDDFDELGVNERYTKSCIDNLLSLVDRIFLITNSEIKYDEHKLLGYSDYDQYEILPFGHKKRAELIEKWNCIGRQETIDINDLHRKSDQVIHHVDAIVRKNLLPSKPIYILTIVQFLDSAEPSNFGLTSYGHCYQSLIQNMLAKINAKANQFDMYANYLSELSYCIFETDEVSLSIEQFDGFKVGYSNKFLINSHDDVIKSLLRAGILKEKNERLFFAHRYIFYFYVSKYISDHKELDTCEKIIDRLCLNMHTEKNANILIFLVHHSKEQHIINKIISKAEEVFNDISEAKLNITDTKYLVDYIVSIPGLVQEHRDVEEERKKRRELKDDIEGFDRCETLNEQEAEDDDKGVLAQVNTAVRIMGIIGQILRNRHGSLTKKQLTDLCQSAYSAGLKMLNNFLTVTREEQEYILNFVNKIFRDNTDLTDEQITDATRNIFLMLCYGGSYSIIHKISNSVGSSELMPIFEKIASEDSDSVAKRLIQISIELEFNKKIPKKVLEDAFLELEKNPISQRLLQEIVVQHLYLNHVSYTDRQWISEKLCVPIEAQRTIQGKKEKRN